MKTLCNFINEKLRKLILIAVDCNFQWVEKMRCSLPTFIISCSRSILHGTRIQPEFMYKTGNWRKLPKNQVNNKPRVAWVLFGNEKVGSSRLKGIVINKFANHNSSGFISQIAYKSLYLNPSLQWKRQEWQPFLNRIDIMVIQTFEGSTLELLMDCRKHGIAVIFALSDLLLPKIQPNFFDMIDVVVVSSERLKVEVLKSHNDVVIIDDPIDVPPNHYKVEMNRGYNPELVWVGHQDNWQETELIKKIINYPEFTNLSFRTISKHPEATHQWRLSSRWKNTTKSDIAVIPCKLDDWGTSKSSNRLTYFMSLGYPIIASPIPSYQKFIHNGVNGFFASTEYEWIEYIRLLRDPRLRHQIGIAAKETPELDELNLEKVTGRWSNLFNRLYHKYNHFST